MVDDLRGMEPYAMIEIGARRCNVAFVPGSAGRSRATSGEVECLASIETRVALDPNGGLAVGESVRRLHVEYPERCVEDLARAFVPGFREGESNRYWPFAPTHRFADGRSGRKLGERIYPTAYLWSRIIAEARAIAEASANQVLRHVALVVSARCRESVRRELRIAALAAGFEHVLFIDSLTALAWSIQESQQRRAQGDTESHASDRNPTVDDSSDPLAAIDALLGVGAKSNEDEDEDAHVEGEDVPAAQDVRESAEPDASEQEPADGNEVSVDPVAKSDEASRGRDTTTVQELSLVIVAGASGTDLALIDLGPSYQTCVRRTFPRLGGDAWDGQLVAAFAREFTEQQGPDSQVDPQADPLACVRLWDASAKVRKSLDTSADGQLDLPHLVADETQSYHLQIAISRRRLEKIIEPELRQFREDFQAICQDAVASGCKIQNVYFCGSLAAAPVFQRIVDSETNLEAPVEYLDGVASLQGAAHWIRELGRSQRRMRFSEHGVGRLEILGGTTVVSLEIDAESLPFRKDISLASPDAASVADANAGFSWRVCEIIEAAREPWMIPAGRIEIRPYPSGKELTIRVSVDRQRRLNFEASPALRRLGVELHYHVLDGLTPSQLATARYEQAVADALRFRAHNCTMIEGALRSALKTIRLGLTEKAEKFDDLLRTRLEEWSEKTREILERESTDVVSPARLVSVKAQYEELLQVREILSRSQREILSVQIVELPEIPEVPVALSVEERESCFERVSAKAPKYEQEEEPSLGQVVSDNIPAEQADDVQAEKPSDILNENHEAENLDGTAGIDPGADRVKDDELPLNEGKSDEGDSSDVDSPTSP